jgi:serine phosphatase RsbU (regulator of sigma subunit)
LEPAYQASGDTYDYMQNDDGLSFAILDAVGHDLSSTLISTLALGAYRNRRRAGDGLAEIADAIDDAIAAQFANGSYATGQLAHLDQITGTLHWLNAGHPLPLLVRDGHAIKELPCRPRAPFGLGSFARGRPEIATFQLQPGDAVLMYTDGIVEARRADGVDFGLERLEQFLARAFADQLSLAETLRRLCHAVLDYHGGRLSDDATTLLVAWHPTRI